MMDTHAALSLCGLALCPPVSMHNSNLEAEMATATAAAAVVRSSGRASAGKESRERPRRRQSEYFAAAAAATADGDGALFARSSQPASAVDRESNRSDGTCPAASG